MRSTTLPPLHSCFMQSSGAFCLGALESSATQAPPALDKPLMDLHRQILRHMSREELMEMNRLLVKARHPEGT